MLLAQLHSKVPHEFEGMEDVLTSSVLGLVRYLPDELACSLLSAFAELPSLSGTPKVCLWPRYPTPAGFRGSEAPQGSKDEVVTRGDTEIIPDGELSFQEGDYAIVIARKESVPKVEEIFTS